MADTQDNGRDDAGRFRPGHDIGAATRYRPGESGNPGGRPHGVTYPGDWMRGLCDSTRAELQRIIDDDDAPQSKRIAARMLLDGTNDDPATRRLAASAVMDRTEGKPRQRHEVRDDREMDIDELIAQVRREVPDLAALRGLVDTSPA